MEQADSCAPTFVLLAKRCENRQHGCITAKHLDCNILYVARGRMFFFMFPKNFSSEKSRRVKNRQSWKFAQPIYPRCPVSTATHEWDLTCTAGGCFAVIWLVAGPKRFTKKIEAHSAFETSETSLVQKHLKQFAALCIAASASSTQQHGCQSTMAWKKDVPNANRLIRRPVLLKNRLIKFCETFQPKISFDHLWYRKCHCHGPSNSDHEINYWEAGNPAGP